MQSKIVIAILILAFPTAIADSHNNVEIEFEEPAHDWGAAEISAPRDTSIAVLVENGTAKIQVVVGTKIIETRLQQVVVNGDDFGSTIPSGQETRNEFFIEQAGWIVLEPAPDSQIASLIDVTDAEAIKVSDVQIQSWSKNDRFANNNIPDGEKFERAYQRQVPWFVPGVVISTNNFQSVQFLSTSVRSFTWTGGDISCEGASPCPNFTKIQEQNINSNGHFSEIVHFEIEMPNVVEVIATQANLHARGEDLSISGEMAARLPRSSGDDCLTIGCDGEQTLRLDGFFHISSIKRIDDRTLQGTIHGDVATLILDETPIDPSLLWTVKAATTAGAMAVAIAILAKLGVFGLFTRISGDEALEHPRRKIIYGYITSHPGATFREIVRNTKIPAGTTRHHLNVMRRSSLVVEKPHKATLRFFENHGKFDASWDTVVMLREAPLNELHAWLTEHPSSPQKDIIAAMEAKGHSRGTTQHRLIRLVDARLVTFRPQGRLKLYEAHSEPVAEVQQDRFCWNGLDAAWPSRV
jgi:DNA-binding transcriptional ArsR family regulator